jgi:hypothetical protein
VGVNVAVYTVEDTAVNVPKEPLLTVISPTAKFDVASLDVKVRDNVASLDVNPSDPSDAVIVMVGDNSSFNVTALFDWDVDAALSAPS